MRRYLVDTTPLSGLLSNRPEIVSLITPWMSAHEAATSILVYGEALEGLKAVRTIRNATRSSRSCWARLRLTLSRTRSCSVTLICVVSSVCPVGRA